MGSVHSINAATELQRFFDFMYGDREGFAYSPTKDPQSESFEQYFFAWPVEKELLIEHCIRQAISKEVYYSPSLFRTRKAEKEDFLGTCFVWTEFDGTTPDIIGDDIPAPTLRVQSSTNDHQHWYWKLDHFETDINIIEDVTQRIAYALRADLSSWNANRVLRPPGTVHHESNRQVQMLRIDPHTSAIKDFTRLPELPIKLLQEDDIKYVPPVLEVIMKYPWNTENTQFFLEKEIPKGSRSSALTKLGHICVETGMSSAETLSILLNADSRWGKFSKRRDQKVRLLGIIDFCRSRHPVEEEKKNSRLTVFNFDDFMDAHIEIEWIIRGLIHKKGLFSVSGPPKVGKSTFFLRFAEKIAKGEQFLSWKPERPTRTLFVSMEMPHEELHFFLQAMKIGANALLKENFLLLPLGSSLKLANKVAQAELEIVIDQFQPDGVIFDSLGKGISDDINGEKIIFETFDYIDHLRSKYKIFTGFVHHPRKSQVGNKKPNKLEDLYGNQYIGAAVTSAVGLWSTGSMIEVDCLAMRMSEKFNSFRVRRTRDNDFTIVENNYTKDTPLFGDPAVGAIDLSNSI